MIEFYAEWFQPGPLPKPVERVGIACRVAQCSGVVFFPTNAIDLDLYLMKGTVCDRHYTEPAQ
jgi:hypothetical protein